MFLIIVHKMSKYSQYQKSFLSKSVFNFIFHFFNGSDCGIFMMINNESMEDILWLKELVF